LLELVDLDGEAIATDVVNIKAVEIW